jgi:sortase (surface protein transpeptidase)
MKLISARLVRRVFLPFALLALLLLLGAQPLPASAASPSFVRLVNASPDVGIVAVFVDGAKFLENVQFATVTNYLQLPAGSHKVQAALIGKGGGSTGIGQTLSVQAGAAYTVVALGTKATGYSLQVFVDNNLMAAGMAKVRFYHLSPGTGPLSIATGRHTVPGALSYAQASNYLKLPAGLYTFMVSASQPAFSLPDQVTLKTNTVTSIFLVGVFHGTPPLQFVHVQVKGLPSMSGTGSDPNALAMNASPFTPLAPWPLGMLALGGMSAGMLTGLWPFIRRRTKGRPPRLYRALLTPAVALAVTVAGLSLASVAANPAPAPFARLLIPTIGVNAPIESIGVRSDGAMETPRQSPWNDVGWYNAGPHPGERGSAVIAGHLDRPGGNPAVFWRLRDLRVGDSVLVVDASGKTLPFHVTRIMSYPPQDAPVQDIFGNNAGRFLNLTTCAGDWIPTQHQTALRLVVYTSAGQTPASPPPSSSPTPAVTPTQTPRPAATPTPTPTPPSPALLCNVSSTNLNFGQILLGHVLRRQLTFGNCGKQTLNWSVTTQTAEGAAWLSVGTSSGTIAPGNSATINVVVNTGSLVVGNYSGTVNITSDGGNQTVNVEMTVIAV